MSSITLPNTSSADGLDTMPEAAGEWGGESGAADAIQKSALVGKGKQGTRGKQQVDKGS